MKTTTVLAFLAFFASDNYIRTPSGSSHGPPFKKMFKRLSLQPLRRLPSKLLAGKPSSGIKQA
ncbi:hypothetical protein EG328_002451 [Venturia inaequalis]|uniref:Uncharacterized protein n=1 Tax=Venturia inaequalis TaxID=5025 RepID=A0A8H3Z1R9_VENIN|nr:hypothetical protein EG328_002451 [Venturia inaequalis]